MLLNPDPLVHTLKIFFVTKWETVIKHLWFILKYNDFLEEKPLCNLNRRLYQLLFMKTIFIGKNIQTNYGYLDLSPAQILSQR